MRKIIERCPACGGVLVVTRLSCSNCQTEISGRFRATVFAGLSPESLAFVETFVRLRGNVKEMERELGVPYSAVRTRLDEVIGELGFDPDASADGPAEPREAPHPNKDLSARRREVLDRLDRGEINAPEATELLSQFKQP